MLADPLAEVLAQAVAEGLTPGGVISLGDAGAAVLERGFGMTAREPAESAAPVTLEVVYDVASLTKPVATTAVLMKLVGAGAIDLDLPAVRLLPELVAPGAADIRVRDLAAHAAGLTAHVPYYERLLAGERLGAPSAREAILRLAGATPLAAAPRSRALYSDLGFILLGFALERAGGARLDALTRRLVLEPLAMAATGFVDLEADPPAPRPAPVAPTERCPYRGLLRGEVHDNNTHAAGGILGQAGLFATAGDLGRFAAAMVGAVGGAARGGFVRELVAPFFVPSGVPGSTWRLGWDAPDPRPGVSAAGDLWSRDGVGHLGFTGCSLWLDPPRGRWVVLLTNAIHPQRAAAGVRRLRRSVMDAAVRALDG